MTLRPVFFSAPHRVMFFAGAVHVVLAMLLWALELGARLADLYPPLIHLPIPAPWLHGVLMLYGIFSFFIFGFLMTALPKWIAMPPLEQHQYLPAFFGLLAGWLVFYLGLALALPWVLSLGLLIVAAGWGLGIMSLFNTTRASASGNKTHAWVVLVALVNGLCGLTFYAAGIFLDHERLVRAGMEAGLWLYLLPVFFTVTCRMLPFFSGNVIRGYVEYRSPVLFWLMLAACGVHMLVATFDLRHGWLVDLAAAGIAFWFTWRWQIHKVFASRLLAIHHMAGLWLGTACLLYALQGFLTDTGWAIGWGGRAPLHALTIGYFGSILIGMATRVTLGHSGRLISSDPWAWRLFWALQGVILLRLVGEWVPGTGGFNPVWLSALGWLLVFGVWNGVHLPMYLKPRPDGRPG